MTGLSTSSALSKLQHSLTEVVSSLTPRYSLSPFATGNVVVSVVVTVVWALVCGFLFDFYISILLITLLAVTLLFFVGDSFLSMKEKTNSVLDILDILQTFSRFHESHSSRYKAGFYLSETYPRSTSVSVQRVYRNGKVVSVSHTLLVEGDIILLSSGEEAPTDCSALNGEIKLKKGDVFNDKNEAKQVFVYGTLKRGFPNHHGHLNHAQFVGPGRLTNRYPLVVATRYHIPYLLDVPGTGHQVQGEVYRVTESELAQLDKLEGYPDYYNRIQVAVHLDQPDDLTAGKQGKGGKVEECFVYILTRFQDELLEKEMVDEYTMEHADSYLLPRERLAPLDKNEVMDLTK